MYPAARESSFYDSMAFCPRMYSQRGLMEGEKKKITLTPQQFLSVAEKPKFNFHMNKTQNLGSG